MKEEVKPIVKEVTETETIKFKTETKTNNNLVKGTQKTVQEGINGEKEITYEVTYDAEVKEISRNKVSEKITKAAVNKIVEIGGADYNISTSKITESTTGFACLETEKTEYCSDGDNSGLFTAIAINVVYYAKCLEGSSTCASIGLKTPTKLTKTGEDLTAIINGKKYYFDRRAGDGSPNTLTIEKCNEYKLVCAN